jgi:hypothetical protein
MTMQRKFLTCCIAVILAASVLLMNESVNAQTIPIPHPPEFTLRIADHSYDVPPTTTSYTDPYTAKTTTSMKPGYHVTNRAIEVRIKNQPFTPYVDTESNSVNLFYNISVKPHYGDTWAYFPTSYRENFPASNSEYTIIEFGYGGVMDIVKPQIGYVTPGGELDFRVQAKIGYYKEIWVRWPGSDSPFAGESVWIFLGQNSQWSNLETIKTPEATTSPSPTVPEALTLAILPLIVVILLVIVYFKRRKSLQKFITRKDNKIYSAHPEIYFALRQGFSTC